MSEHNPDVPEQPQDGLDLDPENTIIIDDSDYEDDVPTIVVEPEIEEVLVVLPDEEDEELQDVPLLSAHPDSDVEPATEPVPTDVYQEFLDDSPQPAEVEALPEIEHVEDITALLEDESVKLEAPTDPHAVRYETESSGRRFPWMALAAAGCLAAVGVLYGPELLERFRPDEAGTVASAQPNQPVTGTDPEQDPLPALPDSELAKVAFREWVTTALSRNLGAAAEPVPGIAPPDGAGSVVEPPVKDPATDTETSTEVNESVPAESDSDQENK